MTTQHDLIGSDVIARSLPILAEAAALIADPQVRYCGTIGGNVANGDPGNDMPALMMTLGASYLLEGPDGSRTVAATDFYQGAYFTALEPGEILTAISIPAPAAGHGYAYEKLKRKVGDYATAAAAVVLTMSGGKVATCSIGLTNLVRNTTSRRGRGESGDRHRPRRGVAEAGRGRCRGDHVAVGRHARTGRIPQACRRHHGDARAEARRRQGQLREAEMAKTHITMKVNGAEVEGLVEPRTLLVHFIRENLQLTGTHIGCETTHCGACTVDIDGMSVKSCTMFAVQADGADILTIEGMANADGTLSALQEGFRQMHGLQCGFCTPGMIVRAHRLLQENPEPDRGGDPLRHLRQSLPLHRLPEHRQGDPVRRRQDQRQRIQGGRRMNDMTPTREQREAKLEGMGCKRKRVEDVRFTQGKGNFVDDLKLPGMLYGDFVRSPYAHARVKSINTKTALKVPGVLAVITAETLKTVNLAWMPTLAGDVQMVLADGKVLFQNQEVAFVVATDRYAADDGINAVEVEYESLPVVVDPFQAMDDGCAGAARRPQRQDQRRAWPAQAPQPHLRMERRRQGPDRRRLPQGGRHDQGADLLSPHPSLAARDLPERRLLRQDQRRTDGLGHVPGAACHPHRGVADRQPARTEDPRDLARRRRRLRQQGRRLSRLYLRDRRFDRHRQAGEMGRGPHREPDRRPPLPATTT